MRGGGTFRVVYPLEAFDGGLNNKYEAAIIADHESPDALNVVYDDRGGVQTRGGSSKLNTTAVGSYSGDGLFTARYNNQAETMCGWWNGTMYTLGATTFTTHGSAQSVFTAGSRVDACQYQNLIFFGDGYAKPYKYNGTAFTRHGIPQPNSGPSTQSGTAGASGAATGDINYKVSYVNSYSVEGDVSAATTTLTIATSASVSLTSLPLAPTSFGVNSRRLYRLDSGSGGSYKLVTTIADNTTTNYTDSTPSASLGAAAPSDQGEPPNWQYSISHQERLFLVTPDNPSYLYYTELADPFVVKVSNYILIGDGDGEVITGLGTQANMIVVFKTNSVWLIYMPDTTPGNWIRIKSNSKYGGYSHYAQADYEDIKLFIGRRYGKVSGFFKLVGGTTEPNSTDLVANNVTSDSVSDRIEPDVFTFTTSALNKACAIEFKNKLWFSVPYSSSTNNRVYQFDFQRRDEAKNDGSWCPFTYPYGFSAFTVYNGKLYGQGAEAAGFVWELDTGTYADNGTAINSYCWTKEFFGYPEHLENWKDFRFGNLTVETLGNYYMNVGYKVDGDSSGGVTQQISLNPGGSTWGSFNWGAATWGGGQTRKKTTVSFGTLNGKRLQLKFSNQSTVNQGFHVYPMGSFSYNVRGKR